MLPIGNTKFLMLLNMDKSDDINSVEQGGLISTSAELNVPIIEVVIDISSST
jgi:hypothetical protein